MLRLIPLVLISLLLSCGTVPLKETPEQEKRIPQSLLKEPEEPVYLEERIGESATDTEVLENLTTNAEIWRLLREQVRAIIKWDKDTFDTIKK